jgi:type IV secretory pathway VirB3-like protein
MPKRRTFSKFQWIRLLFEPIPIHEIDDFQVHSRPITIAIVVIAVVFILIVALFVFVILILIIILIVFIFLTGIFLSVGVFFLFVVLAINNKLGCRSTSSSWRASSNSSGAT